MQRREVQGSSLRTDLPRLGLVAVQHRRLPSWSQVVWDNFPAYFTPKRVWDGIKNCILQDYARLLFIKSDSFSTPANERVKQIQNMSPHFRLAWEMPLLLDEHCQDWGARAHFSLQASRPSAICESPVYTKTLRWCLLLISRIYKWGWNTFLVDKKAQINIPGKDVSRAAIILQMSERSGFHTNKVRLPWASSSRPAVSEQGCERCPSPKATPTGSRCPDTRRCCGTCEPIPQLCLYKQGLPSSTKLNPSKWPPRPFRKLNSSTQELLLHKKMQRLFLSL